MNRPLSLLICFLLPIVVLLVGIISSGIYAFQTIPRALKDDVRAAVPPKFTTRMEIPHRYSLWVYSSVIR